MRLLRWLWGRLDAREQSARERVVVRELAQVLEVEDHPAAVLRAVAELRDDRAYWREQAYQNAIDADHAECFSRLWKGCARKLRGDRNRVVEGVKRVARRAK